MKTAQQRADSVFKKHDAFFIRLLEEATRLVESPGPLDPRARRLLEITDDLAAKVAPAAICRRNCSHCCHQSVIVSSWEAERIGRYCKRKAKEFPVPSAGDSLKPTQRRYSGVPCPFLKRGECSIYVVRPMACRTHFSMEASPDPCDVGANPGGRVALFNFNALLFPQAMLFLNAACSFADVRDYFPAVELDPASAEVVA